MYSVGVHTPETNILPADSFIEIPREKMKDAAMPEVFLRACMLFLHNLSAKSNAALAGFHLDELEKLLAGNTRNAWPRGRGNGPPLPYSRNTGALRYELGGIS
jgi:hypothetical protein